MVDFDDPNDWWQEWFSERWELATDPTLARAIGFYNIYHQSWALIEREKTLMHCGNITFAYHNEFNEYMKVKEAVLDDVFDNLFHVGVKKIISENGKIYLLEIFEK